MERPVGVDAADVEVRTLDRGDERVAFVFNHAPEARDAAIGLSTSAAGVRRAVDLESGETVPVSFAASTARLTLHLAPQQVRVVRLQP